MCLCFDAIAYSQFIQGELAKKYEDGRPLSFQMWNNYFFHNGDYSIIPIKRVKYVEHVEEDIYYKGISYIDKRLKHAKKNKYPLSIPGHNCVFNADKCFNETRLDQQSMQ